jgi:hypothetical protein
MVVVMRMVMIMIAAAAAVVVVVVVVLVIVVAVAVICTYKPCSKKDRLACIQNIIFKEVASVPYPKEKCTFRNDLTLCNDDFKLLFLFCPFLDKNQYN